jgi:DNA-directed RNA polymerase II subunit RPB1
VEHRPSTPIRRSPRSYLEPRAQSGAVTPPPEPAIGSRPEAPATIPGETPSPPQPAHQPESVGLRGVESLARPSAELAPEPVRSPAERAIPSEPMRDDGQPRSEQAGSAEWAPAPPPSADEPGPATRVYAPAATTRPAATPRPPTDEPLPPSTMSEYGTPPPYDPRPRQRMEAAPPQPNRQFAPPPPGWPDRNAPQSDRQLAPPPARAPLPAAPREGPPAVPSGSP